MNYNKKGFSLVEMAIVLIIFGLVMASASSILTLFVNKGGAERTRKMIEANKNVLFSIAASDKHYLDSGDTSRDTNTELVSMLTYPNDAYGRPFSVITDPTLDIGDDGTYDRTNLDYDPICGTDSTTMVLHICNASNDCTNATDYSVVEDVAFVIISGSVNKNIQTAVASNVVKVYAQGFAVDGFTSSVAGGAPFNDANRDDRYDDIVDWVTLPELRAKAGCDPSKLDFLNTDMPGIKEGKDYDFAIYPKGGIPSPNVSAGDIEYYKFEVTGDDDDLLNTGSITLTVEPAIGSIKLGDSASGTHLVFSGNNATLNSSYRLKIKIYDSSDTVSGGSPNDAERTLYIIKQN